MTDDFYTYVKESGYKLIKGSDEWLMVMLLNELEIKLIERIKEDTYPEFMDLIQFTRYCYYTFGIYNFRTRPAIYKLPDYVTSPFPNMQEIDNKAVFWAKKERVNIRKVDDTFVANVPYNSMLYSSKIKIDDIELFEDENFDISMDDYAPVKNDYVIIPVSDNQVQIILHNSDIDILNAQLEFFTFINYEKPNFDIMHDEFVVDKEYLSILRDSKLLHVKKTGDISSIMNIFDRYSIPALFENNILYLRECDLKYTKIFDLTNITVQTVKTVDINNHNVLNKLFSNSFIKKSEIPEMLTRMQTILHTMNINESFDFNDQCLSNYVYLQIGE